MFTGIVEELGRVADIKRGSRSAVIGINCRKVLGGTKIGDSIAVNGVCLTAVRLGEDHFDADVSYETLERTSLGDFRPGTGVNLERALTLNSRVGGHLVQGHVDCVAVVAEISRDGDSWILKINYPRSADRFIVEKGSVCLDGISLTVARNVGLSVEVAVIPHTYENTDLKFKKPGDKINLETDQIARYIEKLLKIDGKEDKLAFLAENLRRPR